VESHHDVCGLMTLVAILEKTGGMALFTDFLARLATPNTATAVTAFFAGFISIYSSTTGVMLPAFLPLVPGLIERIGGGDPMALVSSMVVGGHLVDLSPVSMLGALCMAAAPAGTDLVQSTARLGSVDERGWRTRLRGGF
jgi:di/tricarboxylate transporter